MYYTIQSLYTYQHHLKLEIVCYGKITNLTLRSKFKVKCHQQWYTTHRLEVVYLHAKYEKPILNDKNVTARTRFVTDARTDRLITIECPPQSGGALIKYVNNVAMVTI